MHRSCYWVDTDMNCGWYWGYGVTWYWYTLRCYLYFCFMTVINLTFDWLHKRIFLVIPSYSSCAPSDDSVLSLWSPFLLPPTENILILESSALPKESETKKHLNHQVTWYRYIFFYILLIYSLYINQSILSLYLS